MIFTVKKGRMYNKLAKILLQDKNFVHVMRNKVKYYIELELCYGIIYLKYQEKGVFEDMNKDDLLRNLRI